MGRLTKTIDPANEEVEFEYDEKGRKSKVIYPDDKYVNYSYDEHDRLVTIIDRENRITSYTYDEAGRKKTVKLPNGITTTYNYDLDNRVKEITSTREDGSVVEKVAYDYDGEGNKTLEEIWKEDKYYKGVYTYYKNNTVKSMAETGDNTAEYIYYYDGAGNIDEKTVTEDGVTKTYTYSYNDANRMVTESENGVVRRSYAYDLNGNRTQRIISDDGKPVADYYYYDYTDQLEEVVEHNGKVYTYGYDGEGNRLWRTYSQYPVVKPPVDDGERVEDPAEFPGWNKNKDSELDHDNGKGNDFKVEGGEKKDSNLTSRIEKLMNINLASSDSSYLKNLMFAKQDDSDKENGQGNNGVDKGNGNSGSSEVNNGKDKEPGNGNNNNADKENGKGSDNGKNNSNGNENNNDKEQGNGKDKVNGNSDKSKVKDKENNGKDKNEKENGNGWAKGKDKDKAKGDRGKHLGWYKNGKAGNGNDPHNPGGDELVNPEIFQVTNYINDLSAENEEVLMTSDVDGNYRGVYTYDNNHDLIGVEDLGEIQGKPNDPLYYLKDALGSITSITNMNGEVIDSNRFAPYGEPLDPVAKNARLTNSPYGFTGESHDIEGDLVYLRARYYEPGIMRFLQQDTMLGNIQQPLTRNLYIYGNDNPLKFVDPSGHIIGMPKSIRNDIDDRLKVLMKSKEIIAELKYIIAEADNIIQRAENIEEEISDIWMEYNAELIASIKYGTFDESILPEGTTLDDYSLEDLLVDPTQDEQYQRAMKIIVEMSSLKVYADQMLKELEHDKSAFDTLQELLNIGGMIPVIGEPIDGVNAAIYYVRGDKVNAALSAGSMIPCFGNGFAGVKWVKKGVNITDEIKDATKAADKVYDLSTDTVKQIKGAAKTGGEVVGDARKFWTNATEFNGVKVYQRNDIIDATLVDARGRTNLQRMQQGLAPIGPDGNPVNLHHMIQTNDSAIAEVTQSFHQQNTKTIHINPITIPSGIDRSQFNTWKSNYWKNRANDFK